MTIQSYSLLHPQGYSHIFTTKLLIHTGEKKKKIARSGFRTPVSYIVASASTEKKELHVVLILLFLAYVETLSVNCWREG